MASRKPSVRHPSHSHPLRSHKAQAEEEIICSGCDLDLIGPAFKCTKSDCEYFLHKSCFELPRETQHKAHPEHPLTLLYSPPYESSTYGCNACGEYGSGFVYNCSICQFDLHVGCVSMPESVEREEHEHSLTLLYCSPLEDGLNFTCDVCQESLPNNLWSYYCKECDYNTHLHSCQVEEYEKEEESTKGGGGSRSAQNGGNKGGRGSANSELAAMLEAQREMERMQIELHLEMQRAKIAKKSRKAMLKLI